MMLQGSNLWQRLFIQGRKRKQWSSVHWKPAGYWMQGVCCGKRQVGGLARGSGHAFLFGNSLIDKSFERIYFCKMWCNPKHFYLINLLYLLLPCLYLAHLQGLLACHCLHFIFTTIGCGNFTICILACFLKCALDHLSLNQKYRCITGFKLF